MDAVAPIATPIDFKKMGQGTVIMGTYTSVGVPGIFRFFLNLLADRCSEAGCGRQLVVDIGHLACIRRS